MEIELYSKINDPLKFIETLGEWLGKSGMTGGDRIEQGKVLAAACLFEKKSPIQILREYHIFNGRLSDRADAMLSKFRARGGKHKILKRDENESSVELTYDGQTFTSSVTFEELKKEPFVYGKDGKTCKTNYASPRARMQTMWARVVSDGIRALAPEIVSGVYTPEEIMDTETVIQAETGTPLKNIHQASAELKAKPANVTKVETVKPEPQPAAEPAAPSSTVATESPVPTAETKFDLSKVSVVPGTSALNADTVAALQAAIGEDLADKALEWLKKRGWIKNFISDLSVERAKRLLEKPEDFRGFVAKGAAQ